MMDAIYTTLCLQSKKTLLSVKFPSKIINHHNKRRKSYPQWNQEVSRKIRLQSTFTSINFKKAI